MRRGRREKITTRGTGKYLLYTSLIILGVMVITFITTFLIYNNKIKNINYSEFTAEKIAELVPNEANSELEQANASLGKSIEDVVKQFEEDLKEENEEEIKEENINKEIEEDNEKVETTNTEPVTTNTKPEVIKDPEFSMPVEGEIIRGFAKDSLIYSNTLEEWITHLGIDIKASRTTVVKAAENGKVIAIKNDPRYGLTVVIEHVNGFKSIYSNLLTSEFVSEGDEVEKGQSIGTVGNYASFEIVDEQHLHFEILKDDIQVDPNIYIK